MEETPVNVWKAMGKIRDGNGLHLKVASEISRACAKMNCKVKVAKDDTHSADAKSPLALLTLGAPAERILTFTAEGPDAAKIAEALEPYILFIP